MISIISKLYIMHSRTSIIQPPVVTVISILDQLHAGSNFKHVRQQSVLMWTTLLACMYMCKSVKQLVQSICLSLLKRKLKEYQKHKMWNVIVYLGTRGFMLADTFRVMSTPCMVPSCPDSQGSTVLWVHTRWDKSLLWHSSTGNSTN
jgi:hypothetical protein